MANGTKIEVTKGFWTGLKGTVVSVNGDTVNVAPDGEADLVGTFNLDEIKVAG